MFNIYFIIIEDNLPSYFDYYYIQMFGLLGFLGIIATYFNWYS